MNNFIIIAYCTPGPYAEEARNLKASLDRQRLFYEIKAIDSLGNWQKNCLYKPYFIQEMLRKFDMPVLYVDADAIFHRFPQLIYELECDFAAHYFKGTQLASGTLYFKNSIPSFNLISYWKDNCKLFPQDPDQLNLQRAVEKPEWQNRINVTYLPPEYCKIFDLTPDCNEPVIEHFQASRRLRC